MDNRRKVFTYSIPENLPFDQLIESRPPGTTIEQARSAYIYIIGKIVKENTEYGKNGYTTKFCHPVQLSSTALRAILGYKSTLFINVLINNAVILFEKELVGQRNRAYYLTAPFRNQKISAELILDERLIKKLKTRDMEELHKLQDTYSNYTPVLHGFTTNKLALDHLKATAFIENMYRSLTIRLFSNNIAEEDKIDVWKREISSRNFNAKYIIDKFRKKEYSFWIDSKGRRVYSRLSEMMSILRHFLKYDDRDLVSLDIKNSQPFHLCFLLQPTFWINVDNPYSLYNIDRKLYERFQDQGILNNIIDHINDIQGNPQVKRFEKITIKKDLYDFLVKKFSNEFEGASNPYKDRPTAKRTVMKFLNFKTTNKKFNKDYKLFCAEFLPVTELLHLIKSSRHTDMSTILQRLEAKILLEDVSNAIMQKYRKLPIFSVHDSLIIDKEVTTEVINIMKRIYRKIFGFVPEIKETELIPSNAYSELDQYLESRLNDERLLRMNLDEETLNQIVEEFKSDILSQNKL